MKYDVIIIGSGISGLFTLKHCLEKNLKCIILEKTENIGGVWNIKNDPSVLNNTYSVSSKLYLSISDFPIPEDYPEFPHWSLVLEYYNSYVKKLNLEKFIKFNNKVFSLKKINNIWNINVNNNIIYKTTNIVVASGSTNECLNFPDDDIFNNFTGLSFHSNDIGKFNLDNKIKNKNVLIIGGSDTASDISVELSKNNTVYMSIPNGQWFQDRIIGANEPADMYYNRFINFLTKCFKNYIHNKFGTDSITLFGVQEEVVLKNGYQNANI